jgi:peptidoglycan/LPS O-acetylase OafA/YrhL
MEDLEETRAATGPATTHRRDDVDGLRCLAVAAVLAFHALDGYDAGFCGVDVFFAVSGFVVAASLKRRERPSTRAFLVEFYARRAKRLAPALACAIVAAAVGLRLVPLPDRDARIASDAALCALGGASNIFFAMLFARERRRDAQIESSAPAGYFSRDWGRTEKEVFRHAADANPFLHTWSLGVEEQFYLVLPCLFLVAHAIRRDHAPAAVAAAACLASLVCGIVFLVLGEPDLAFYLLPSRLWELAAGWLVCECGHVPARHAGKVDLLGAAFLGYAAVASRPAQYPLPGALPAILGTCCVLANTHGRLNAFLSTIPLPEIGRASYGLYLYHWPLLVLFRLGLAHQILATVVALILSIPLTAASFVYLETPVRAWRPKRRAAPLYATLFGFGACAIAVRELRPGDRRASGTSGGEFPADAALPGPPFFGSQFDRNAWDRVETNGTCGEAAYFASCGAVRGVPCACAATCGPATTHLPAGAGAGPIPCFRNATPQCQGWYSTDFDAGAWPFGVWRSECFFLSSAAGSGGVDAAAVRACLEPCGRRTAWLVGDSHAGSHAAGLAAALAAYGVDLRHAFAGYGCSFASDAFNGALMDAVGSGWAFEACAEWVRAIKTTLLEVASPGDLLFTTTAAWKYDIVGHADAAFVQELHTLDASLVVLGDAPLLRGVFGVNCASPGTRPACVTEETETVPAGALLAERAWAELGVPFVPVRGLFCADGACDAHVPGTDVLALVDYGHLTTAGSLYLAPFLACALESLGLVNAADVPIAEEAECPGSVTDL